MLLSLFCRATRDLSCWTPSSPLSAPGPCCSIQPPNILDCRCMPICYPRGRTPAICALFGSPSEASTRSRNLRRCGKERRDCNSGPVSACGGPSAGLLPSTRALPRKCQCLSSFNVVFPPQRHCRCPSAGLFGSDWCSFRWSWVRWRWRRRCCGLGWVPSRYQRGSWCFSSPSWSRSNHLRHPWARRRLGWPSWELSSWQYRQLSVFSPYHFFMTDCCSYCLESV